MTGQGVGQLRVRRGHDGGGTLRKIILTVDGEVVAKLSQGEEVLLQVLPGERVVQARMDWATSPDLKLSVQPGGEASASVTLPGSAIWRSFFTPGRALTATLVSQR